LFENTYTSPGAEFAGAQCQGSAGAILATNLNAAEAMMTIAPDNPLDHKRVIAFLARYSTTPIDEIARLYEREWAALEASARLKRYLPTLTFRHVRALCRKVNVKVPTLLSRAHVPIDGGPDDASTRAGKV
jgi:hypothetical protein